MHTDIVVGVAVAVVVFVYALFLLDAVGVLVFADAELVHGLVVAMMFVHFVKAVDEVVVEEAAVAAADAIESATRVVPFVLLQEDLGVSGVLLVDPFQCSLVL